MRGILTLTGNDDLPRAKREITKTFSGNRPPKRIKDCTHRIERVRSADLLADYYAELEDEARVVA